MSDLVKFKPKQDHSWEAQYIMLCLLEPETLYSHPVDHSVFDNFHHRRAFDIVKDLAEQGRCNLQSFGEVWLKEKKGHGYLSTMPNGYDLSEAHIVSDALKDARLRRQLKKIGQALIKADEDMRTPAKDIRDEAHSLLLEDITGSDKRQSLYEILCPVQARILGKLPAPKNISTGFKLLDDQIGGFERSKLILVASRPGEGKTAFGLQAAVSAAKAGHEVYFGSLEMSAEQLAFRLFGMEGSVNGLDMRLGNLTPLEKERIEKALSQLQGLPIAICTKGNRTIEDLRADILFAQTNRKIDLIVVDYVQLMRSKERTDQRWEELGMITNELKSLAKETDSAILALAQLNRIAAEEEPQLHHLRGSGDLEQAADIVISLWRPDARDRTRVKITVLKNRDGGVGHFYSAFTPEYTRFE